MRIAGGDPPAPGDPDRRRGPADQLISWSGCGSRPRPWRHRAAPGRRCPGRHVREPALLHLLGALVEPGHRLLVEHDHLAAGCDRRLLAGLLDLIPDGAELARDRSAGIGVDDRLQVVRQALVALLVHEKGEYGGAEPLSVRTLDRVVGQLVDLERQDDLVGHQGAVDHALGERLGQLGHRHADRLGVPRLDQHRAGARRDAQLQPGQILDLVDRLVDHVERLAGMRVDQDRMHVLEIRRDQIEHVLDRERGRLGAAAMHGRQLEHLRARKHAGRVAGQGPDDVGDTVPRLAVELGRRAAERHRGIDLDLDAAVRLLLDPARPGLDELGMGRRLGADEVMDREGDLGLLRRDPVRGTHRDAHRDQTGSQIQTSHRCLLARSLRASASAFASFACRTFVCYTHARRRPFVKGRACRLAIVAPGAPMPSSAALPKPHTDDMIVASGYNVARAKESEQPEEGPVTRKAWFGVLLGTALAASAGCPDRAGQDRHDHHAVGRRGGPRHRRARRLHAGDRGGGRQARRPGGRAPGRGRRHAARSRQADRRQVHQAGRGRHPDRHHLVEPRARRGAVRGQ